MTSAHEQIDKELALAALQKRKAGETPSSKELAALKRVDNAKEEEHRRLLYRTVPKKDYQDLSGRPRKVLIDQAKYGLPVVGPVIDLGPVLCWFHDLLAKLARTKSGRRFLARQDSDLSADTPSPADEYQIERAKLAKMERMERERQLVARELSHACWQRVAHRLQQIGVSLETEYGPEMLKIWNDGLKDCSREVEAVFGPAIQNTGID